MPLSSAPRVTRGAIISIDPFNPLASNTIFQYNPSELTRSLAPQTTQEDQDRSEAMRLKGPPIETISLKAEIDAADQLNVTDTMTAVFGIYPQLSALEMLIYPKINQVIVNKSLLAAGTLEILPNRAPLTLFVWGVNRVLPIRINSFSITEQAYDANLNPIRAEISLELRVLSYEDLSMNDLGYYVFLRHQVLKETMAMLNKVNQTTKPVVKK
jgi:hypothetical protein